MDKRELLKSMLANFIKDNHEEASVDFHNYATAKMRDVAGVSPAADDTNTQTIDDDDDLDPNNNFGDPEDDE